MNPSRSRGCQGACAFLRVVLCVCLGASPVVGAPKKGRSAAPKPRAAQTDAFPQADQAAGEDLKLKTEDERMADAVAAFVDGFIAEENADDDRKLESYQRSLTLDPSNSGLAVIVAMDIAKRGDVPQAISILKDAIKYAPKDPAPCICLAQFYEKLLKKPDLALKYLNQALDLDPGNFAVHLALYKLYVNTNDPKHAEQIIDRAVKLPNDKPQFWLDLARLYTRLYVRDENATFAPESVKKLDVVLEKAVAAGQDDPTVLSEAAGYYVVAQQLKDAIRLYLAALKLKPSKNEPELAAIPEKLARSYLALGQRENAVIVLKKSLEQNPGEPESYNLLGQIYAEDRKLEEAQKCFRDSLAVNDRQALTYLHLADVLLGLKKGDETISVLEQGRKKIPDEPRMTYSLALALGQMKKSKEALAAFDQSFREAQATQPDMLGAMFYFSYGAAAEQAGEVERAAELLKKSIELDPQNAAQANNYLGYMWVERGEHLDEAVGLIRKALQTAPENGAYLDSLGWYYYKKGDYKQALAELLKAAENTKPEDATVFEHLGDTYKALNDAPNAVAYWQKAAALDPESKKLAEKIDGVKQKVTSNPTPKTDGN